MADQQDGDSQASAGKSPAGSKLDSLSREDMIKFVKKQMLMLQKTRSKCDELTKKIKDLESNKTEGAAGDGNSVKDLEIKIKELEDEKQDILTAYQTVQQTQELSIQKFHDVESHCTELTEQRDNLEKQLASVSQSKK
ncbi:Hypothetical predicted protein, partial [Mytilus galloprovincialis]